jgi:hypothetical protein
LTQHTGESFDDVTREGINIGEERREKVATMLRTPAYYVDPFGRKDREG